MWVFTKNGFFSAVAHRDRPGFLLVRARFAGDLERLCKAHDIKPEVRETPDADYRFRMDFDRNTWAWVMEGESECIDYPNFKAAVHDGTPRDEAYMGCWSALRRGQEWAAPSRRRRP